MPKKSYTRRRKRTFSLRRVRITPENVLSTLATDTAIVTGITGAAVGSYRAISVKGTWNVSSLVEGEGPLTVGLAHGDYSITEIKECLESFQSIDPGEKIAQERGNRLVRIVGVLTGKLNSLNNGIKISTRLNWLIVPGDLINMFVYNEGTASLTTGAIVNLQGDMWVKDSA